MPTPTPPHRFAADPLVVAQDGVATVHQLMDLGCASSAIAAHCRPPGPWRRLLPRVILLRTAAPTIQQRLRGALLYAGPDALLTGPAALALYGLESVPRLGSHPKVDVVVARRAVPRSHAYVRVRPTVRPALRVPVRNLACAPLPRAVVDALPHLADPASLAALLTEVTERGLCRPDDVAAEVRAAAPAGDPRVAAVLQRVVGPDAGSL
ncbi:hypothetical protein ACF1G0_20905 [Streptomyces sp. NPDC013953]|uniref:hypothetical protein n=1 Tax=Streptomyces sp. NPDC013953 TaxID=3364868 RepID=UPI0036F4E9C6